MVQFPTMSRIENGMGHPLDELSPVLVSSIKGVMELFVADNIMDGFSPEDDVYCDPCQDLQPAIGAINYDGNTFCNPCSTEYELFRLGVGHSIVDPGAYIRRQQFLSSNSQGEIPLSSCGENSDSI